MANHLFHQSLKKKLLDLLSFNFQFKELDDNKIQSGTKVQEVTFMNYYYSHGISRVSTQQEDDENRLGYYSSSSISHQTTDKSSCMSSEISFIRHDHGHGHGHVRVRREVSSKVEKKKCPRCSRWCKYYSTKTNSSTGAGSVSTIIMCPSCGKKFNPKVTSSAANKLATKSSTLHWQKQDHRRLSLQVC